MFQHKLIYVHDPMCSWCWGYRSTWLKLKAALEHTLIIEYKVGGLAPDNHDPMPQNMKDRLESTWHTISARLGTLFNYSFWSDCEPRRSTYPACRAALIARKANKECEMIEAIQRAYYLNAQNPSDKSTLINLAQQIGLNTIKFSAQLNSPQLNTELKQELAYTRLLPIQGFPSLVLIKQHKVYPIDINYTDWRHSVHQIATMLGLF